MLLSPKTHVYQSALASWSRTGRETYIPSVKPERGRIYRDLIWNGIEDTLKRAYPITNAVLKPTDWYFLVSRFMRQHRSSSPQLWRMPEEFMQYCVDNKLPELMNCLALADLLLFEWVEIEVFMMPDLSDMAVKKAHSAGKKGVLLNPEHRHIRLQYPVHRIKFQELPLHKGNYHLIAYRHRTLLKVNFVEISPALIKLCDYIRDQVVDLQEILRNAALISATEGENFINAALNSGLLLNTEE